MARCISHLGYPANKSDISGFRHIHMGNYGYLAVLAFCFVGTLWLEVFLRTRVYRRWLRLILSVIPVALVFVAWDLYAISAGHWDFDTSQIVGVEVVGGIPIDEVLFFLVIPSCAILTLEAVRAVRGWPVGDEVSDRQEGSA